MFWYNDGNDDLQGRDSGDDVDDDDVVQGGGGDDDDLHCGDVDDDVAQGGGGPHLISLCSFSSPCSPLQSPQRTSSQTISSSTSTPNMVT